MTPLHPRILLAALVALVVVAGLLLFTGGSSTRMVSAHFSQAISVYKGSDVDIMGVRVGRVTAVVPEGDSVRVDMEYDAKYKLPAQVKAAIVTPTLTADRFVQLAPAYDGGATLPSGGDIPVDRTAEPVELDRIYKSIGDLTSALGPNGANKHGALSDLLGASAKALKGNGQVGHQMLSNLSAAMQTLGDNSGQLFGTVDNLASVTQTLDANNKVVGSFMDHLSTVSSQLAGERGDLRKALVAIANAVGIVRGFVHNNKAAVISDVKQLTTTVGVLAKERNTLAKVLQLAPLGLGNLSEAFDVRTGTVGIRFQATQTLSDLGNVLCGVLTANGLPQPQRGQACTLLKALLPAPSTGAASTPSSPGSPGSSGGPGGTPPASTLGGLVAPLGGLP